MKLVILASLFIAAAYAGAIDFDRDVNVNWEIYKVIGQFLHKFSSNLVYKPSAKW